MVCSRGPTSFYFCNCCRNEDAFNLWLLWSVLLEVRMEQVLLNPESYWFLAAQLFLVHSVLLWHIAWGPWFLAFLFREEGWQSVRPLEAAVALLHSTSLRLSLWHNFTDKSRSLSQAPSWKRGVHLYQGPRRREKGRGYTAPTTKHHGTCL